MIPTILMIVSVGQHTVVQIENKPISLPFYDHFNGIEDKLYTSDQLGISGALRWDFETEGFGKMRTNSFDGTMLISPTLSTQSDNINNYSILTLNMANYNVDNQNIGLKFKYRSIPQLGSTNAAELFNQVHVRGSDADEWIEIYTLKDTEIEWKTIGGLKISDVLEANDQEFSSSFQVRFSQNNITEIEIDEVSVFELGVETPEEVVEIVNFTGEQVGEQVVLKWTTSIQPDDEFFEVQVADNYTNGADVEFLVIGTVNGFGTTTQPYIFNDTRPGKKGQKYYRLKQVNANGDFTFSPVLMVDYDVQKNEIFPNPFTDKVNIVYESEEETVIDLILSDNNGRIVQQLTSDVQIGTQEVQILIEQELPSGMYFLRIVDQEKSTIHKLFKQSR